MNSFFGGQNPIIRLQIGKLSTNNCEEFFLSLSFRTPDVQPKFPKNGTAKPDLYRRRVPNYPLQRPSRRGARSRRWRRFRPLKRLHFENEFRFRWNIAPPRLSVGAIARHPRTAALGDVDDFINPVAKSPLRIIQKRQPNWIGARPRLRFQDEAFKGCDERNKHPSNPMSFYDFGETEKMILMQMRKEERIYFLFSDGEEQTV